MSCSDMPVTITKWRGSTVSRSDDETTRPAVKNWFTVITTCRCLPRDASASSTNPKGRPENPFPYVSEVMTGFEYAAAVGMLYEGLEAEGLTCIGLIRARYDGLHRNPFDEAECGHHYARAMELRSLGRKDDALAAFATMKESFASYVPT